MLEVNDIHTYYGNSHVLRGVSLQVKAGAVTSLLGRNGAGKTTTALSVMGYLKPRLGSITYAGRAIAGLPSYSISRMGVGFVPQERGIFPSLSVEENLTVAARSGRDNRWTLARIYEMFPRLKERRNNRGFQLSGGEQQMVAIARALMLNPSVIVLDEPSEGLAPLIVDEIVEILRRMKSEGLAILLIEQNLSAALDLGDIHYVLSKGEVCFSGTSDMLRSNERVLSDYLSV
ncbi:high-affinity branched-chain amino acid transport ATP-binding protein LivF (plasmid) [Cupriavidus necator N-1]|uniref:High-affinity branched-chain amino acid transport ATP-binding protein LivF n=1 Tax=Cupriavidus necator (strain ATCC 43291 / DSM 13513 / CCUG 52238 / LMG 8453 / N-1) TaxID=1042878 RepID=F8GVN7_CUPNN|nr:ABC transporter ATP-binding protein [Cupriavidus necator]AEI82657.1 high-affinity branched-chain amino acid transport ATP-binding protein LivF [Cupriavidus necator N-1]MDX6007650.1 ABC transporter ATP-binding protein [Cupriavidus necator]